MSLFRKKGDEEPKKTFEDDYWESDRDSEDAPIIEPQTAHEPARAEPRRAQPDRPRKVYDELATPVKVRNRTPQDDRNVVTPVRSAPRQSAAPVAGAAVIGESNAGPDTESGPEEEWRGGTWADSDYSMTDEEAHRDRVYEPPSFLTQTLTVMFAQMKTFSKRRNLITIIIAIALIPGICFVVPEFVDSIAKSWGLYMSNAYVGLLLAFLPLSLAFFTAMQCGKQVPDEFKERTAYMSIPLPMHRLSFYFGKYLAGFVYCVAVYLLAYGVAIACASVKFDEFYTDIMLTSILATIVAVLVYSSTAFCLGCFLRRGSVLLPIILNVVVFPMLFILMAVRFDSLEFLAMPVFLPDVVIQSMGSSVSMSMTGMLTLFSGGQVGYGDIGTMCVYGIIWTIGFLALGAFRMTRREM